MSIDTQYYKKELEQEKAQLEDELASLGIRDPENDDWGAILGTAHSADRSDTNNMADRYEEFGERSYTLGELEIRYRHIQKALTRIKEGTYGTCEVGGEAIAEERLKADPAAATCVAHSEEQSAS